MKQKQFWRLSFKDLGASFIQNEQKICGFVILSFGLQNYSVGYEQWGWTQMATLQRACYCTIGSVPNGNIFRITGHLCGEFTGPRWIPHKGQWRGALMSSLICARINGWVNTGEAGDLRRHRAIVIVMQCILEKQCTMYYVSTFFCVT